MVSASSENDAENEVDAQDVINPNQNIRSKADEKILEEWLIRVIDQDQEALNLLYEALVGQVYGLALRMLRNVQAAEEVVQETFWQVWRQAPRFDSTRGGVKTWVLTIARSRTLDMLRSNKNYECELEPELQDTLTMTWNEDSQDLLAASQQGDTLHSAMLKLETLPRQLVSLAFFRGLSHEEVAEFTGLPLGTVKSHLRRALQTMRQVLVASQIEI